MLDKCDKSRNKAVCGRSGDVDGLFFFILRDRFAL